MTGQVMLYAVIVGLLIVPAAWLADRAAMLCRVPRRWGWVAALVIALALPMFAPLRNAARPDGLVSGAGAAIADQQGPRAVWTVVALGVRDGFVDLGSALASWEAWASTVWVTSSAAAAIAFVAGAATLRRRRRDWRATSALNTEVVVARRLGPAVVGVVRPVIVLPEWAMHLDRETLALIVRHEREHVAARDPWLVHAAALAVVVMPWNPAVWWLASRLRLAVEFDCDARVLACAADPSSEIATYGEVLLTVASRHERIGGMLAPAMIESASSLSRRIAAMCAASVRFSRTKTAIVGSLAALLLVIACGAPVPSGRAESSDAGATTGPVGPEPTTVTSPPTELEPPPAAVVEAPPAATRPIEILQGVSVRGISTAGVRFDSPAVRRLGPGVRNPRVLHQVRPSYTPGAMRRKVQGTVQLEALVDERGTVADVRVVKPLDDDLDIEAMKAARAWRFDPATVEGRPVPTVVALELQFSIH